MSGARGRAGFTDGCKGYAHPWSPGGVSCRVTRRPTPPRPSPVSPSLSPFSPSGPLSVFPPFLPPPCPAHSSSASHHRDPVVQARARARPRSPAMQALERAMQNRTVIIIAHRLSTGSTGARADPSGESKGRCRLATAASKRPRGRHHRPPPQNFMCEDAATARRAAERRASVWLGIVERLPTWCGIEDAESMQT